MELDKDFCPINYSVQHLERPKSESVAKLGEIIGDKLGCWFEMLGGVIDYIKSGELKPAEGKLDITYLMGFREVLIKSIENGTLTGYLKSSPALRKVAEHAVASLDELIADAEKASVEEVEKLKTGIREKEARQKEEEAKFEEKYGWRMIEDKTTIDALAKQFEFWGEMGFSASMYECEIGEGYSLIFSVKDDGWLSFGLHLMKKDNQAYEEIAAYDSNRDEECYAFILGHRLLDLGIDPETFKNSINKSLDKFVHGIAIEGVNKHDEGHVAQKFYAVFKGIDKDKKFNPHEAFRARLNELKDRFSEEHKGINPDVFEKMIHDIFEQYLQTSMHLIRLSFDEDRRYLD